MHNLTPRDIVNELDRHIVGQDQAKRAVAVAVRNRWRRQRLDPAIAREVAPKNIIMSGPTGVGKTEIARRLADLVGAPFIKVEATKYTEVGYHGRDVESMVRDLLELGISMIKRDHAADVRQQAEDAVDRRLVRVLLGEEASHAPAPVAVGAAGDAPAAAPDPLARTRERLHGKLREGEFEDREIEIEIREKSKNPILGMMGPEQMDPGMASMIDGLMPERHSRRRVTVARARALLLEEETEKLIDHEKIIEQAIGRTEETGIIFLDEIDKIAAPSGRDGGSADVSRAGVQRDLLPIVEGSAVSTRHGIVHTDQILFIAAGAFHSTAVSDLMPELQGRFPIRVKLDALTREDLRRILTEPDGNLTLQHQALLGTEGLEVDFTPDALEALADAAAEANDSLENIGARRFMTIMERVFEDISFDAPDLEARGEPTSITITAEFVRERVEALVEDQDLRQFVL